MKDLKKYSDIFVDVDNLDTFRDTVESDTKDRFENYEMIYKFDNMRPLHKDKDLKKRQRREMINFGASNKEAQEFVAPMEALVTGTNEPIKIKFDTDNFFVDSGLSAYATDTFNELIYKDSSDMATLWRTICGYGWQRGSVPIVNDYEDVGLYPRVADNLRFPVGTPLSIEKGVNFFEFYEATYYTLQQMLTSITEGEDTFLNEKGIKGILEDIEASYRSDGSQTGTDDDVIIESTSANDDEFIDYSKVTVSIVRYAEIRTDKKGNRYLSIIEYVRGYDIDDKSNNALHIIYTEKKAFKMAKEALMNCVFDEEIGGRKTTDNTRGMGEAVLPSNSAKEQLKNKRYQGAIASAEPTILTNDNMDPDEALRFRMGVHGVAPDGMTADSFFYPPDNSGAIDGVITELDRTSTGITSGSKSNTSRGQESRNQTLDRLAINRPIRGNRLSKATGLLVNINTWLIDRLLSLEPSPESADYNTIKYYQYRFDQKVIELLALEDDENRDKKAKEYRKKLVERKFGYHVHLAVETRRVVGDDPERDENAMQIVGQMLQQGTFDAQTAPDLKRWMLLTATNDDDLVRAAFRDPEPIRKDQTLLAAMEWDIIGRGAFAGEQGEWEPQTSDIHIDHVQRHLIDLIADVNMHGVDPWDQADVMKYGAHVNHVGKHIRVVQQQPESRGIFKQIFPLFQQVVKQSALIIDELAAEQEAQEAQEGDDPETQSKILLNIENARLARTKTQQIMQKMGLDINEADRLETQTNLRNSREGEKLDLMKREKYLKEIQFNLDLQEDNQDTK